MWAGQTCCGGESRKSERRECAQRARQRESVLRRDEGRRQRCTRDRASRRAASVRRDPNATGLPAAARQYWDCIASHVYHSNKLKALSTARRGFTRARGVQQKRQRHVGPRSPGPRPASRARRALGVGLVPRGCSHAANLNIHREARGRTPPASRLPTAAAAHLHRPAHAHLHPASPQAVAPPQAPLPYSADRRAPHVASPRRSTATPGLSGVPVELGPPARPPLLSLRATGAAACSMASRKSQQNSAASVIDGCECLQHEGSGLYAVLMPCRPR